MNCRKVSGGFSLIELIGVLAVVSILAVALAPILIKQLDQIAGDKEISQMKLFAVTFRQGVAKTKTIPNESGWAQLIATNLGLQIDQVRTNDRRQPRVFMIDPALRVNGAVLPYAQTMNGAAPAPVNLRLIILASISTPLPATITNGVASSAAVFSNIWECTEGTVPVGWAWSGPGTDLKIQRLNIDDLFVPLTLSKDAATTGSAGNFSIDAFGPSAVPSDSFTSSYIDGTALGLYDRSATPVLQYGEFLHKAKSFTFVLGTWKGERFLGKTIDRLSAVDLQRAANAFTDSKTNTCAANSGVTTWTVYYAMISYMSNYVNWCDSGWQGCTTFGNKNPSGTFGTVLNGSQATPGSQAYLNSKTTALICQQAN